MGKVMRVAIRHRSALVRALATLAAVILSSGTVAHANSTSVSLFSSSRLLLLNQALLPRHFTYRGYFVQYSVEQWDGGIKPIMAIDERYGWVEAAEERVRDPHKFEVMLSVQLFRTSKGARSDFAQFFTNAHPETIYVPGSTWLGGAPLSGLGDRATIYRISDDNSSCKDHLTSGVSFVYRNALFSVGLCLESVGEQAAKDLARRLLTHAQRSKG